METNISCESCKNTFMWNSQAIFKCQLKLKYFHILFVLFSFLPYSKQIQASWQTASMDALTYPSNVNLINTLTSYVIEPRCGFSSNAQKNIGYFIDHSQNTRSESREHMTFQTT